MFGHESGGGAGRIREEFFLGGAFEKLNGMLLLAKIKFLTFLSKLNLNTFRFVEWFNCFFVIVNLQNILIHKDYFLNVSDFKGFN